MRRLLLKNKQSPGDIVMLTAAVRDLHRAHPGQFETWVKTSAMPLWEHNPKVRLGEPDQALAVEAETIECAYPLIHHSNSRPWHFIHGFHQHLESLLGVKIPPTDFRGDIHLTQQERNWMSQVQEITKVPVPFWILVAGGKMDYTAKWWARERFQEVVNHFAGRILFVQVGAKEHRHDDLQGVLDLRGKTQIRQLVRLVYHSQGVLCPVTFLMHLAAAVPVKQGPPGSRPCVVVAGGREPPHWEAYPTHQFIHTAGALPCCQHGGCWKSRVVPVGDGDKKDQPNRMCVDVVHTTQAELSFQRKSDAPVPEHAVAEAAGRQLTDYLPRCMDMISAAEVIRRIQLYFDGGATRFLNDKERAIVNRTIFKSTKRRNVLV
jgi:ADP-heptose:LPS heptosyltransferase